MIANEERQNYVLKVAIITLRDVASVSVRYNWLIISNRRLLSTEDNIMDN